ncbi:hypothetical protein WR25_15461 [Diploscapter pachys]|uniref:C3H1-type domain-containing protein n=1 Tax=Diploscapter pachys TaxID=2018661 RepID=A0A2A2KXH8_9BILA|nr:hypothetical protein WR25_15461 [Diploscapter pachys]
MNQPGPLQWGRNAPSSAYPTIQPPSSFVPQGAFQMFHDRVSFPVPPPNYPPHTSHQSPQQRHYYQQQEAPTYTQPYHHAPPPPQPTVYHQSDRMVVMDDASLYQQQQQQHSPASVQLASTAPQTYTNAIYVNTAPTIEQQRTVTIVADTSNARTSRWVVPPSSSSRTVHLTVPALSPAEPNSPPPRTVVISDSPVLPAKRKVGVRKEEERAKGREKAKKLKAEPSTSKESEPKEKEEDKEKAEKELICASIEPHTYASLDANGVFPTPICLQQPPKLVRLMDSDNQHEPGYTIGDFEYCAMPVNPAIASIRFDDDFRLFKKIRNRINHNLSRFPHHDVIREHMKEEFSQIETLYPSFKDKTFPIRPKTSIVSSVPQQTATTWTNPAVYGNSSPARGGNNGNGNSTRAQPPDAPTDDNSVIASTFQIQPKPAIAVVNGRKPLAASPVIAKTTAVPGPSNQAAVAAAAAPVPRQETKLVARGQLQVVPAFTSPKQKSQIPSRNAMSLRFINGQKVLGGSNECFNHIKGSCPAGIFCRFEHEGKMDHTKKRVCFRLLRGRCRPTDSCPNSHDLLPHQLPICEFFLALKCTHQDCPLIHVNYGIDSKPCENFQKGICMKGAECEYPHRYIYQVIKERSQPEDRAQFRYDASRQQQQQQPISSGKSSPTSESDKNKAGQSEQSGESRGETSGEVTGGESAEEEEEEKEDAEGDDERTEDDTSTFPFFE